MELYSWSVSFISLVNLYARFLPPPRLNVTFENTLANFIIIEFHELNSMCPYHICVVVAVVLDKTHKKDEAD